MPDDYRLGPSWVLVQTAGGNTLGPHTVTVLGLFEGTNRQFSGLAQPHALEGMKLAERHDPGARIPRLVAVTALAIW